VGTATTEALATVGLSGKTPVGTMQISGVACDRSRTAKCCFWSTNSLIEGYDGVLFAYQYAKYGLAPVGVVATGPSVVDKNNIDKVMKVFNTYANVVGFK
jgi:simple sugar transport system substrate-binding protein